jgi:hypothetical protein
MRKKSARRTLRPMALAPTTSRLIDASHGPEAYAAGNSLAWILEPLEAEQTFTSRRMFGCLAAYLDGLIYLVVAAKREPWNGLLVCTSKDRHMLLTQQWHALQPHQVLGKWLYVSQDDPQFEAVARQVTAAVLSRDPRLGVEPKPKAKKPGARKPTGKSKSARSRS